MYRSHYSEGRTSHMYRSHYSEASEKPRRQYSPSHMYCRISL
jgi:hypothetical protein